MFSGKNPNENAEDEIIKHVTPHNTVG
jgi:hypothetical protein